MKKNCTKIWKCAKNVPNLLNNLEYKPIIIASDYSKLQITTTILDF